MKFEVLGGMRKGGLGLNFALEATDLSSSATSLAKTSQLRYDDNHYPTLS